MHDYLLVTMWFIIKHVFRVLVEQLERLNLSQMETNAQTAFWINMYNSMIMHVSICWLKMYNY